MGTIVVGTDGSKRSVGALTWAARAAQVHGATLEVVFAWHVPQPPFRRAAADLARQDLEAAAQRMLDDLLEQCDTTGIEVVTSAVEDRAAPALLTAARTADLLVVGSRGQGGFKGLLLGSVGLQCVTHAPGPVVVVPTGRADTDADDDDAGEPTSGEVSRVVVGVDGSPASQLALLWAMDEAALRDVPLVAVMAWSYLDQHHTAGEPEFTSEYHEADAKAALDAAVDSALESSPVGGDVTIERLTPFFLPALALVQLARPDDLLVVGNRGHGGFTGLLLGSVSQEVVSRAPCPVAVIRPDDDAAE